MSMEFPLTLAGNEPVIFRFVAQHVNHCAIAVPIIIIIIIIITFLLSHINLAAFQRVWFTDQALPIHNSAKRFLTTTELQLSGR